MVQNREDGKNVGGWHWEEKNMFAWAKQQLEELLTAIPAAEAGGLRVAKLKTVTGEVRRRAHDMRRRSAAADGGSLGGGAWRRAGCSCGVEKHAEQRSAQRKL